MALLAAFATVISLTVLFAGFVRLALVPFSIAFERRHGRPDDSVPVDVGTIFDAPPLVSIIVPAYNEEVVLENCLRSILSSEYARYEVICVDDGSTDATYAVARAFADEEAHVVALTQPNGGKGAALNTGLARARGSVLLLVDADGLFQPHTITRMLQAFRHADIGAVCGNDRTVNLDRVQTRFLALIGHLGTGLMRRSLHELHCLPIVSGNIGAYRRDVLAMIGRVRTDTVGEDLELTWRVYGAGYRVAFAPHAVLYAESPSTPRALWRQRVRWARGLLQVSRRHSAMIGDLDLGPFGMYLAYTVFTQVVVPFLQVFGVVTLAVLATTGQDAVLPTGLWQAGTFLGLPVALLLLLLAVLLDGAPRDLRYAWTLPIWPVYSALMSLVMVRAVWLEMKGAENRWNKLDRTGTVSVSGLVGRTGPSS
ncbi:glycosyltransferase [Mumia zhuanghuii]|uniref:Glycosyltransferase family 2 protein n=1 Tax=Mumia zhuanghuii TaxID=2585211 RepID=A0A5C4MHJ7_9ACTN|nr:glycosyltransferase family 2 protein [Mumia zhuanghuii]TNC42476.1 glycosyltransferase family 2 protein [Mumia zhuanghuii]TNC43728.1 glycosyltransferase family 2 protein [Mumia zhuanghuii]